MSLEPLEFTTVEIGRPLAGALRRAAYTHGRVLERDGLEILGIGAAQVIALDGGLAGSAGVGDVHRRLAAIVPSATSGSARPYGPAPGPLALGALPFDRHRAGGLVVPEVTVVTRAPGPPVAVVVGSSARVLELASLLALAPDNDIEAIATAVSASMPPAADEPGDGSAAPPDRFALESARPHEDFLRRVAAAVAEVRSGTLDKLVLAREVTVRANRPLRQSDLLGRLRALHPSCLAFALDGFIGATPELLIAREGAEISSHPLAGTAARSGDVAADRRSEAALLASAKDRAEHRAVVDTIATALGPLTTRLEVPAEPQILELRNVSHLATKICGQLRPLDDVYPSALELVACLHPTPAVAGTPVDAAIDYLAKLEDLDRDRYAGPVGWMDSNGDGEWHLGLRCALVSGATARLFAGVGIVADSDPAAELAETQLKLQAFLAAAVRP